jgi:hypothetical protein
MKPRSIDVVVKVDTTRFDEAIEAQRRALDAGRRRDAFSGWLWTNDPEMHAELVRFRTTLLPADAFVHSNGTWSTR